MTSKHDPMLGAQTGWAFAREQAHRTPGWLESIFVWVVSVDVGAVLGLLLHRVVGLL